MKTIIAGSRDLENYGRLLEIIRDSGFVITEVVSGAARGVDMMGERYAKEHHIRLSTKPAHWLVYGKKAGFIRNQEMADYAEQLICYHTNSAGSKDMVKKMRLLGKPVYEVIEVEGSMIPIINKYNMEKSNV